MYIVLTRSFPPEVGGMQNLMWGLTNSLSKYFMIKVFADYHHQHESYDKEVSFSVERVGGIKLLRKYRKAHLVNEFIKNNKNIKGIIADHWKSLELIKTNKKKICLIHSKEINHVKETNLNKRVLNVLNNVDHVVSNSQYTKNLAINCGVTQSKITVINPGVNPAKELHKKTIKEAENLLKNKSPRLITVSRLDKRKNHEKIIMALRNLKQIYPNIIYTCVGDGDEIVDLGACFRPIPGRHDAAYAISAAKKAIDVGVSERRVVGARRRALAKACPGGGRRRAGSPRSRLRRMSARGSCAALADEPSMNDT